jgi:xanthine dehydrogenase/oxidase
MRLLASVDGTAVTTVEALGGEREGYNPIQDALATEFGTQCGFCSPGWVMNMYSLLEKNPNPTSAEIERHLDGNLCRCTGYRPIVAAFQQFAADDKSAPQNEAVFAGATANSTTKHLKRKGGNVKKSNMSQTPCSRRYHQSIASSKKGPIAEMVQRKATTTSLHFKDAQSGQEYYKPSDLQEFQVLVSDLGSAGREMRFNVGNTGASIAKYLANKGIIVPGDYQPEKVIIDVKDISQLTEISAQADGVVLGAAVSLSDVIDTLRAEDARRGNLAARGSTFEQVARHLTRIAGKQVRPCGCEHSPPPPLICFLALLLLFSTSDPHQSASIFSHPNSLLFPAPARQNRSEMLVLGQAMWR